MEPQLLPLVRASRLFTDAEESTIRAAADAGSVTKHDAGDVVFRAGDVPHDFLIVRQGLVQVVRRSGNAPETTLGIFGPREPIGLPASLGRAPFPADAIAACNGVLILRLRADVVHEAMQRDAGLVRGLNQVLLEHTTLLRDKIAVLTAGEVPARLATLLAHLAERFGDEASDGTTHVPVALNRNDLARLVNARLETVTRVMTRWQREAVVETTKDGFRILDAPRLAAS